MYQVKCAELCILSTFIQSYETLSLTGVSFVVQLCVVCSVD